MTRSNTPAVATFAALLSAFSLVLWSLAGCEREILLFPPSADRPVIHLSESTPHIVLITLDTTRADALGTYGQALAPTPYLDRLAAEGVTFENCETAAPNTLPAHATLFTGRFPFSHGVRSNTHYVLPETQRTLAEALADAGYLTAAEVAAPVLNAETQIAQGFERYSDLHPTEIERRSLDPDAATASPVPDGQRSASDITDSGIRFIEAHADEPFFLWLHYFDPHMPYVAPPDYASRQPDSAYHAEVMYADAQIERVFATLNKLSLADRTLVVFTSDHGESLNQHTEETHGFYVYRSTIHVPLLLWGLDAFPKGKRVASLVRTADIAPTILDYAGLDPLSDIHGVSLRPLIDGPDDDLSLVGYAESAEPYITFGATPLRSLTRGQWRYIHKVNPELYDLANDPHETLNLAAREPDRLEALARELGELVQSAPSDGGAAIRRMDRDTQQQLEALGYASGSAPPTHLDGAEALALTGPDPNDLTDDLRQLTIAGGRRDEGDLEGARQLYLDLWTRHPTSLPILVGLINATSDLGLTDEQIPLLRRLIELDPDEQAAYSKLAALLGSKNDLEGAERVLLRALDRFPCIDGARLTLSGIAHASQRYREEYALLDYAVSNCEPADPLLNNYAFILATSPVDELRDGLRAVEIAKDIVTRATLPNPAYLDTLAASYAEVELYDFALELERKAIELLHALGAEPELIATFEDNLAIFESKQPLRSP